MNIENMNALQLRQELYRQAEMKNKFLKLCIWSLACVKDEHTSLTEALKEAIQESEQ